jgi:zinc/manganese transport system permease protein
MNLGLWDIMAPAFFECLILVGIHSYLGLHVIRRKVIFVDLALAQIAALGTTVGFLFGIMPGSSGAYWFSLAFAIIGAAIFSLSRFRNEKIPQEAIIGLSYAIAASIAILVIDRAPHGAEHIKELLTGSILWVKWSTIGYAAIVYSAVGIFHYIFREKFILISENPEKAYQSGVSVRLWDFLFYISFGIVITHSVGTAGVLLVFVFLVAPAIISIMITDTLWKQLLIGWGMGLIVSVSGLYISYSADLPSGPTVVAFYGLLLIIVSLILFIVRSDNKKAAAKKLIGGLLTFTLVVFLIISIGRLLRSDHTHQEHTIHNDLSAVAAATPLDSLQLLFDKSDDMDKKNSIALKMAQLDKKCAVENLIKMLKECEYPFLRAEIIENINRIAGKQFSYDAEKSTDENSENITKIESEFNL